MRLHRSFALGLGAAAWLAIVGVQWGASCAAAEQPVAAPRIDVETADFPSAVDELVEKYQRPEGRGATTANAWGSLVEAMRLINAADARVWRDSGGVPPDYTLIYSGRGDGEAPSDEDVAARATAVAMIAAAEGDGLDRVLDEMKGRVRAARAKIGSPERAEEMKAAGVEGVEPFSGRLLDVLLPDLGRIRGVARLNAARMHLAAEKGDWKKFVAVFEQSLALGRVTAHQPMLIDRLVAVAATSLALGHAQMHIMERKPDAATLEAIGAAMDRQLVWPSLSLPMEGERLLALDTCRWAFAGKGPGGTVDAKHVAEVQALSGGAPDLKGTKDFATRGETVALLEEFYAGAVTEAALARNERGKAGFDARKFVDERVTGRYIVAQLMLPALGKAVNASDQLQLEIAGTRAMLAAERFERAKGAYPRALEDAVEFGDVGAMKDPWSRDGAPVRYRLLGAPESNGRAYLVYSVGNDGQDDAGNAAGLKSRWDAINKEGVSGVDFVVNEVRE